MVRVGVLVHMSYSQRKEEVGGDIGAIILPCLTRSNVSRYETRNTSRR